MYISGLKTKSSIKISYHSLCFVAAHSVSKREINQLRGNHASKK